MSPVVDCNIKEPITDSKLLNMHISPVAECDVKEEIDTSFLTVQISPLSESDRVDEVVCPPLPSGNPFHCSFLSCPLSRALRSVQPGAIDVELLNCSGDLQLDTLADDDDLTSLDWLQDINLLRNISPDQQECFDPFAVAYGTQKENALKVPYHPKHNPCGKPPCSFSVLIFMAIESSPQRRLPVKGIYEWIADQFPFYRRASLGWHNSVRHNLSLNKCFRKLEKVKNCYSAQMCKCVFFSCYLLDLLLLMYQYVEHNRKCDNLVV